MTRTEAATLFPPCARGAPEAERHRPRIASAHAAGAKLDWAAFFAGTGAKRVPLPTYPFQRKRYWLDLRAAPATPSSIGQSDPEHPLLGAAVEDPNGEGLTLTGRLSLATHPWLADHAVGGRRPPARHRLLRAGPAGRRAGRRREPSRS